MLEIRDLSVSYDGAPAVVDADLDVPDGSVTALLGPSGCGKSTLLRAVAGLETPRNGTLSWDGDDLAGRPTHKRGFALMFQDGQLFAHLTCARNIGYALRLQRTPRAQVDVRVRELLALVGLEGYADRLPATLSGGERQRIALARSLAARPRLLLLDEPLSALDAGLRERLAADLRDILRAAGTTTLLVTHDHEEAFAVADRLVVMREGRVVQQGDIAAVWRRPVDAATALFLGYARVLDGEPARAIREVAGLEGGPDASVALRRSALAVPAGGAARGDGAVLGARVRTSRATPDLVRLVVEADGIGELDAVASPSASVRPGDRVELEADPSRMAVVET